jgi:pyruvate/2-oxoglutarate/acetoin dehydrogenase E1 component
MALILSEVISNNSEDLVLNRGGLILGQCLSAVGWVGGTVPKLPGHPGIVELSMADVAGGAIAVGAALNGIKPVIYVVRYQGFLWYNAITIINYAAKTQEMFDVECPLLVRAIAMEGSIGPVAGGSHHSLFLRMPGINVIAPMTPREWTSGWNFHYGGNTQPTILSEHRLSYTISADFEEYRSSNPEVTILGISAGRISAEQASKQLIHEGFHVDLFHLVWLSPLNLPEGFLESLQSSKFAVIVDSDFGNWGAAESLAFQILKLVPQARIEVLGLRQESAGFSAQTDNLTPSGVNVVDAIKRVLA